MLTDNEIIKALEYCRDYDCVNCTVEDCKDPLRFALSIINRQKEELDDLKRDDLPRCKDALRRANKIGIDLEKENKELKAEVDKLELLNSILLESCAGYSKACDAYKAEIERLTKENDELKNGFFQEHYKEIECQELLSVKEAWRKESLHNIDLEAEIEGLNGYINTNCLDCAGCKQWKCDCSNIKAEAIKEFAEKMKGVIPNIDDTYIERIVEDYIDNLVKEMVGEDK